MKRNTSLTFALLGGGMLTGFLLPPLFFGQSNANGSGPVFDVVSIKQAPPVGVGEGMRHNSFAYLTDRLICQANILELIEEAYQVKDFEIAGPTWLNRDVFAIQALMPVGTTKENARLMLQETLSERFHLTYHWESRPVHLFALIPGKHGVNLRAAADVEHRDKDKIAVPAISKQMRASVLTQKGQFYAVAMSLDELAKNYLSVAVEEPVINMTGLTSEYKIDLQWTPTEGPGFSNPMKDPAFLTAVEEQMGLQLQKRTLPYKILVVDQIERIPIAN